LLVEADELKYWGF